MERTTADTLIRLLTSIDGSLKKIARNSEPVELEPVLNIVHSEVTREEFEDLKRYVSNIASVAQQANTWASSLRPIGGPGQVRFE